MLVEFYKASSVKGMADVGLLNTIKRQMEEMNIPFSLSKALMLSVMGDNIGYVQFLLSKGADVHTNNEHCLKYAVTHNYYDITFELLKAGADVHVYNDFLLSKTVNNEYDDILRLLILFGANIHMDNDIIIKNAIRKGNVNIIRVILEESDIPKSKILEGMYYVQDKSRKYKSNYKQIYQILKDYYNDNF